jgi:hypothetical protein
MADAAPRRRYRMPLVRPAAMLSGSLGHVATVAIRGAADCGVGLVVGNGVLPMLRPAHPTSRRWPTSARRRLNGSLARDSGAPRRDDDMPPAQPQRRHRSAFGIAAWRTLPVRTIARRQAIGVDADARPHVSGHHEPFGRDRDTVGGAAGALDVLLRCAAPDGDD